MFNFKTQLYKHQRDAVDKLIKLKVSALYMQPGTGKTRTVLEMINNRLDRGKIEHVIWLCPCSVKTNLRRDIIKHIGYLPDCITVCGIETLSSSIQENIKLLNLVKETKCYLIVDESNLIKNPFAKRTINITRLASYCEYKTILNGTPVTRDQTDLFAQWFILDWRILGYKSYWSFAANHIEYDPNIPNKVRRCLNVDYLTYKIEPYSFQINKSDCLDLPSKTYSTYYYSLTSEQAEHYYMVFDEMLDKVNEFKPETIYRLFTATQLVVSGRMITNFKGRITSTPFFNNFDDNPRLQALARVINSIDDKVIIFCKYTFEIDAIVDYLNKTYGDGSAVKHNGDLSLNQRSKSIQQFENTSRFFVANKNCAGYGLNLQFCSYIIFYSNDWDYGTREQAEDRIHRIGQNKNVHIIDICCEKTIDEQILSCLIRKENLVDSFIKNIRKEQKNAKDIQFQKCL